MRALIFPFLACLLLPLWSCGDDGSGSTDGDTDGDTDTDTDTDSDTDLDTDTDIDTDTDTDTDTNGDDFNPGQDACPDVEWKKDALIEEGAVMPFAEMQGFIDQDGDGLSETEEVTFDLCYLHQTGKEELRIVIGALW